MFHQLKISYKIYLMSAIQLLLIGLLGGLSIIQMTNIGEELSDIAESDIPLTKSLTLLTEHQLHQTILFERSILEGILATQNYPGAKEKFTQVSAEMKKAKSNIKIEIIEIEEFIAEKIPHLHSQAAIDEYTHVLDLLKKVETNYSILERESARAIALIESGDINNAIKQSSIVEAFENNLDQSIVDILNEVQQFTLDAAELARLHEESAIKTTTGLFIFAMVIALLAPFLIGRSITSPIHQLNHRLDEVANGDGDLTLRLDDTANNETGATAKAFNHFMVTLVKTIKDVSHSADDLGASSEEAVRIMSKMLNNVQTQQDETAMVANAMEEMRTATQHVAQNTAEAAKVAEDARQRVQDGQAAAIDTQNIITQLANEMNGASSVIQSLASETDNIGNVLEAIRGIAEQTNLLALNAAIEAARAGDTGRGFAVVADEVRSLAQRTQSSTGDIQTLVESLQAEAQNAVLSMQKGASSTEKCLEKSDETAAALADASQAVNAISDLNVQIASTAEEQSAAAEQIKSNVLNISKIAEETSQETAETASANQAISENIIGLHKSLGQFKV